MVILIFGENCTGKSTVAAKVAESVECKIYSGKDYLRLAKSEAEAITKFRDLAKEHAAGAPHLIYVAAEPEQLALLPDADIKVKVLADLETIKTRFAKRMNGTLPPPVAAMLERKHGLFDAEPCTIQLRNVDDSSLEEAARQVLSLLR